jgi:glycosyltransferase involved in cell wall biosynthesis
MRILLVSGIWPPDVGGPATHMPEVADFLHSRGHEVRVITTASVQPEARPYSVGWVPRSCRPGVRHVSMAARIAGLARLTDVVYATSVPTRAAVGTGLSRTPLVLKLTTDDAFERASRLGWFTGDMDAFQHTSGLRSRLLRSVRDTAVGRAGCLVCPSKYLAELAVGWGASLDRVRVIPNAAPAVARLPSKSEARRRLGLEGTTLVFAGRIGPQKALDVALDALALTRGTRLLLAGEGPDQPALEERAHELGLDGRVRFLGPQPHLCVLELFRAADASLLTSDWENFPHGVVESLAVGTPVIATAVGGVREIVENEVNGLLVPPRDPNALARAIERLAGEHGLRQRLGAQAIPSVADYAPERVLERLELTLQSVIAAA